MIFIFMSFPWYEMNYSHEVLDSETKQAKNEFDIEMNIVFHLDEFSVEGKSGNITTPEITSSYDSEADKEIKEVMEYTYYFYLIAAIMLIIAMAFIPIVAIGKLPHVIGLIFLLLALVFVLIIPLYFYFSLPPAIESTFDKAEWGEPMNSTFKYNNEFLSSGKGTQYYDFDYDDQEEEIQYKLSWGPGLGFWFVFIPLITIVVAQAVYSAGKHDLSSTKMPPPRDRRPPRGYDDGYDDHGGRGPARPRDYDRGPPPQRPPPRRRQNRTDYGPPRPMGDDDYDYINRLQSTRGGDDGGYDPSPPPRPPRRR
jgi:hypothetical protein